MYKTEPQPTKAKEERHLSMATELATTLIDSFTVQEKVECIKTIKELVMSDYQYKIESCEGALKEINKQFDMFKSGINEN